MPVPQFGPPADPVAEGVKDVEEQLAYERSVRELPPPSGMLCYCHDIFM